MMNLEKPNIAESVVAVAIILLLGTISLFVGTMLLASFSDSDAQDRNAPIVEEPAVAHVAGRVLDRDGRPIAGAGDPRIRSHP